MAKEAKIYNGVKKVSSTSGFWKVGQIHATKQKQKRRRKKKEKETRPISYIIYKHKLKWVNQPWDF